MRSNSPSLVKFPRAAGRLVLLLSVLLAVSSRISAQEAGPVVTDRPTDSASPLTVPRHALQLEAGYKFSRFEGDQERDQVDTQVFPDLLLRYGFTPKFELRLVAAGWTAQDSVTGKTDGFSDISLGAKFGLADEQGMRPQMGLLIDVSVPVGHDDFTNDYVIPKVLFLASNTLSDRLALTYNLGPVVVTSEENGEKRTDWDFNYAFALSLATGGSVTLFGELYGALLAGENRDDRQYFQFGGTMLLSDRLQIDLRGGVGLVDHEPDWLVGAGIAYRLPF